MKRGDVIELVAAALFIGVLLGYTLGLIQQAAWKTKAMEKNKCEVKQQHSW